MASFAIILVVCGALCSIGGMHFPPAEALVTHEESSPFPPLLPTRRYGPPEFFNGDSSSQRTPTKLGLQDWVPGTPPQNPPKKPGPGIAEEPAVPDSNPIPVPGTAEELAVPDSDQIPVPDSDPIPVPDSDPIPVPDSDPIPVPDTAEEPVVPDSNPIPVPGTTVAEELPNSVGGTPPKKPGLQDLHLIQVPITGGGPSAYP